MGEHVVGPDALLRTRARSRGCLGAVLLRQRSSVVWSWVALRCNPPVFRRVRNSPHISVRIEGRTNQKVFSVCAHRKAVRHPRGHAGAARQVTDHDRGFQLQRARTAKPATLRARHQHHALIGKRTHPVEADDTHRNFYAYARASPHRFGSRDFHKRPPAPETRFKREPYLLWQIELRPDDDKGNPAS